MVGASLHAADFADYVQESDPAQADTLLQEYAGDVWTVRFFKPLDPTTYTVDLDVRTGRVVAFRRNLPQEAAATAVSPTRARQIAEGFLRQNDLLPTGLNLISAQDRSYQHRMDYEFVWAKQDPRLPETRIWHQVTVQGDAVGAYRAAYVHVPEAWTHARAARAQWAILALVVIVPLVLAGIVMALIYLIRRRAPWQTALWLVLAGCLVTGLTQVPGWSAGLLAYDTQMVWAAFLTLRALGWIFGPLLPGAGGAGCGAVAGSYVALLSLLGIPLSALVMELLARLWLQSLLSRWLRSRLLGALAVGLVLGGLLATGAVVLGRGSVLPGLLSGLVDGLLYGVAFWVGGLPLTVAARTVQLLLQEGLLQVSAPLAPAQVVGWTALALAVVLPFAGAWLGRRVLGSTVVADAGVAGDGDAESGAADE